MNAPHTIYLDCAATTPVDPQVADAMWQVMGVRGAFANAASGYPSGGYAAEAVARAREQVAALIDAKPGEVIWTSGATESVNLAIKGVAQFNRRRGRHIVSVRTEHRATLDACAALARDGFEVELLSPDCTGRIDPEIVRAALRDDTQLVSVMHVNNEIGVVHDVATIASICRGSGVTCHVDATQSVGKMALSLAQSPIDLMSFSAHKLYGPKGAGALFVRRRPRVRLHPQMHGGGHQAGMRAGTLATHQIVGMGEACRLAAERMSADNTHLQGLGERLRRALAGVSGIIVNGHPEHRVPGIINISVAGVDGEALLAELTLPRSSDDSVLAVSSGSACAAADAGPSYVLRALGHDDALAAASVRISPGRFTTVADMEAAAARIRSAVERLRGLSPLWRESGFARPSVEFAHAL